MYDQTFHVKSLQKEFLQKDFVRLPALINPVVQKRIIDESIEISNTNFDKMLLRTHELKGKPVYQIQGLAHELLIRKINRNIRRVTKVRQSDRSTIIKAIINLSKEGLEFRVYKLDLSAFYESISIEGMLDLLENDSAFSKKSVDLLASFFQRAKLLSVSGVPRGIAISATLTEYAMRKFDDKIQHHPKVFFYSRFVDDIFIITKGDEIPKLFMRELKKKLFTGLTFNHKKCRYFDIENSKKKKIFKPTKIDFLGYEFTLQNIVNNIDGRRERIVSVDIAESKVKKIQTKIIKSFRQYDKDGKFQDLSDRVKLLTGNFTIFDQYKKAKTKSGIYYSYSLICSENSIALKKLDSFLRGMILAEYFNKTRKLSKSQKKNLLKITFSNGHLSKIFYYYPNKRLGNLMSCWSYA